MPFNEENGLLIADSDAYFGGQMRTYAMWCNQKLALAGATDSIPFNEKAMCQKFQDGTFIATMLQVRLQSTAFSSNSRRLFRLVCRLGDARVDRQL